MNLLQSILIGRGLDQKVRVGNGNRFEMKSLCAVLKVYGIEINDCEDDASD